MILLAFFALSSITGLALGKTIYCSQNKILYDEWGCKPVQGNHSELCPDHYDCSFFFNTPPNQCFLQGKRFKENDRIEGEGLGQRCKNICHCNTNKQPADFTCAIIDCAYYMSNQDEKCRPVFDKIDQCCPSTACEPFDGKARCKYQNTTVIEGQRVAPTKCDTCLCMNNGKFQCTKNKCLAEIFEIESLRKKCAPVYSHDNCCPVSWKCRSQNDKIIPRDPPAPNTNSTCQFGELKLKIGDTLFEAVNKENGYLCYCEMPPLLTCWKFST